MSVVDVRLGTVADAAGLARVHTQSWREAYQGLVPADLLAKRVVQPESWVEWLTESHPRAAVFVAVEDTAVVGFVAVGPQRPPVEDLGAGQLYAIYLLADGWGRGTGHRLHAAGTSALLAHDFRSAILWVLDSNARAIAFYEREGWHFDGHAQVEAAGAEPLSELRMSRPL